MSTHMALDDILMAVGDWVGLIDELPAEALVTLPDILTEGATRSGAMLVEVPAVSTASVGISRSRVQGDQ
jgi:hypothetical protein